MYDYPSSLGNPTVPDIAAGLEITLNYSNSTYYSARAVYPPPAGSRVDIDWPAVNVMNHHCIEPNADGTLNLTAQNFTGPVDNAAKPMTRAQEMVKLAHDNGAKIMITLGGANTDTTGKPNFTTCCNSPTLRATLVNNICNFVYDNGYDGISLDWEPLDDNKGPNWKILVQDLRNGLDARGSGKKLSVAQLHPSNGPLKGDYAINTAAVIQAIDWVDLMSYTLVSSWDNTFDSFHHSALDDGGYRFINGGGTPPTIKSFVNIFEEAGVPLNKMNVGVAFYGLKWTGGGITAPKQHWVTSTPGLVVRPQQDFKNIVLEAAYQVPANRKWDDDAKAPYVSVTNANPGQTMYLCYDDAASMAEKVTWCANRGVRGIMIWEWANAYLQEKSWPTTADPKINVGLTLDQRTPLMTAIRQQHQTLFGRVPNPAALTRGTFL
jgi:chitinase